MLIRLAVATITAAFAAGAAFVSTARADYETTSLYWSGYATSGEYHTSAFDSPCSPTSGSAAEFNGPGYVTVALIDPSGGWRQSYRGNVHPVSVYVQPDTFAQAASWTKTALCKNSSPWQITFGMWCGLWYWVQDPPHLQCV